MYSMTARNRFVNLHRHLELWSFSPIYEHLVCEFFLKTPSIMSISTNIHRPYACDPLGPYIILVINSIDPIQPY